MENGGRTPRFLNDEKMHGPDDQPVKWHPKKTDKPKWINMDYLGFSNPLIIKHIIYDEANLQYPAFFVDLINQNGIILR